MNTHPEQGKENSAHQAQSPISILARAKDEWQRTFDAVPDLVMLVDRDYRVQRVNLAMADRLGAVPSEIELCSLEWVAFCGDPASLPLLP